MKFYKNKKKEILVFLLVILISIFFLVVNLHPIIFIVFYLYLMRWSKGVKIEINKDEIVIKYIHKKNIIKIDTIEYIGETKFGIFSKEIYFIPISSFENQKYYKFGVFLNEYYNLYDNAWSIRLSRKFLNENGENVGEFLNKEHGIPIINTKR